MNSLNYTGACGTKLELALEDEPGRLYTTADSF